MLLSMSSRDGNGAGRGRVSLSHTHPRIKNSSPSPSPYPNPTGIKLFFHPHPHRVTGIISYPYPYLCSNYFNINFYKRKKITVKRYYEIFNIRRIFFDAKYLKINYNCLHFILEYQIKFHVNQNIC